MTYSSLHTHSHFSLDGIGTIDQWVQGAKNKGLHGIAITDHGDSSSLLELHTLGKKYDFPVTMGCEIYLVDKLTTEEGKPKKGYYHLTVLVKNFKGYQNLCKLSSISFNRDHFYYKPRVTIEELFNHKEGLVIGSGCLAGPICREFLNNNIQLAEEYIKEFSKQFKDDYYLEFQPSIVIEDDKHDGKNQQELVNLYLLDCSKKYNIKRIITPDAHIIDSSMKILQDIKLHVGSDKGWDFDQSHHLFTPTQLREQIEKHHPYLITELEDMMQNTIEISNKTQFDMPKFEPLLPEIDIKSHPLYKPGYTAEMLLYAIIIDNGRIDFNNKQYVDRLKYECDALFENGKISFLPYFLLLEDVVRWCDQNNITVGPGRGSAAGSLLSYALKITHLDPIKYLLSFDRFINKARILNGTFPDVDLDFSDSSVVKKYIVDKYGEDKVAILGVSQTLKTKAAIKDVLSALRPDMDFTDKNALTKPLPSSDQGENELEFFHSIMDPTKYPEFHKFMTENQDVYNAVEALLGQARQRGRHACAVVISSKPLSDVMPLYNDKNEWVTQYSADWVKKVGAVKYDFLGLNTLNDITNCIKLIEQNKNIKINPYSIPLDDKKTFEAFSRADTETVFQFHTNVAKSILSELDKVESLDDLSVVTALGRPGTMDIGMDKTFIRRKNFEEKIVLPHSSLRDVLKDTCGIMVYQEQVMLAVQILGGFNATEADDVRRAMGVKNLQLLNSYKERFCTYAIKNYKDIDEARANGLWDQIESFARYGFNKSHSAAYSLIGYICQYLRQHYPLEWYCSVFSNGSKDDRKKLYPSIKNMVELPSLNKSKKDFYIKDDRIITSLSFINGMGDRSVEECVSKAPFVSFEDFFERVNKRIVRKDIIASLIFSNCFRDVDNRSKTELIELLYKLGKNQLPDEFKDLTTLKIAELEMEALPIQDMDYSFIFNDLANGKVNKISDIKKLPNDSYMSVIGKISKILKKKTKKGDDMAFFDLNNAGEKIRVVVWPNKLNFAQKILKDGNIVQLDGKVNRWKDTTSLIFEKSKIL